MSALGHGRAVCDSSSQLLAIIGGSVRFGNGETSRLRLLRVLIDGCEALTVGSLPLIVRRSAPPARYHRTFRKQNNSTSNLVDLVRSSARGSVGESVNFGHVLSRTSQGRVSAYTRYVPPVGP